jgi:FtsH-binding integral membrane protein
MGKHRDVEAGGMACPYMIESSQLRWAFIRKVYVIVSMQLLATIAVASTVYLVPDIRRFFLARTPAALAAFVLIIVAPIIGELACASSFSALPTNVLSVWMRRNHVELLLIFAGMHGTVMIPMMCLRNRHPINLILLALFTICMSFSVGLGCLSSKGIKRGHKLIYAFVPRVSCESETPVSKHLESHPR